MTNKTIINVNVFNIVIPKQYHKYTETWYKPIQTPIWYCDIDTTELDRFKRWYKFEFGQDYEKETIDQTIYMQRYKEKHILYGLIGTPYYIYNGTYNRDIDKQISFHNQLNQKPYNNTETNYWNIYNEFHLLFKQQDNMFNLQYLEKKEEKDSLEINRNIDDAIKCSHEMSDLRLSIHPKINHEIQQKSSRYSELLKRIETNIQILSSNTPYLKTIEDKITTDLTERMKPYSEKSKEIQNKLDEERVKHDNLKKDFESLQINHDTIKNTQYIVDFANMQHDIKYIIKICEFEIGNIVKKYPERLISIDNYNHHKFGRKIITNYVVNNKAFTQSKSLKDKQNITKQERNKVSLEKDKLSANQNKVQQKINSANHTIMKTLFPKLEKQNNEKDVLSKNIQEKEQELTSLSLKDCNDNADKKVIELKTRILFNEVDSLKEKLKSIVSEIDSIMSYIQIQEGIIRDNTKEKDSIEEQLKLIEERLKIVIEKETVLSEEYKEEVKEFQKKDNVEREKISNEIKVYFNISKSLNTLHLHIIYPELSNIDDLRKTWQRSNIKPEIQKQKYLEMYNYMNNIVRFIRENDRINNRFEAETPEKSQELYKEFCKNIKDNINDEYFMNSLFDKYKVISDTFKTNYDHYMTTLESFYGMTVLKSGKFDSVNFGLQYQKEKKRQDNYCSSYYELNNKIKQLFETKYKNIEKSFSNIDNKIYGQGRLEELTKTINDEEKYILRCEKEISEKLKKLKEENTLLEIHKTEFKLLNNT